MNAFKKLIIELANIECFMDDYYRHDMDMYNYLYQIKDGINEKDCEKIQYCLEKIILRYRKDNNIAFFSGRDNNFDLKNKHIELLQEILNNLNPEDIVMKSIEKNAIKTNKTIFLSHKSNDKKYADALRNFIIGLGVKENQLIYTSHPLHKIPLDENIYDYLRNNIHSSIFMIILWSNEYLESPACLNEMGAAWVVQSDYTNVYVPSFDFGNPKYHECAIDTRKMGAVLNGNENCKTSIIELKNKIEEMFELKNEEQKAIYLIDEFIKQITK